MVISNLFDKIFFNKYAIWTDTAFAVGLLLKSAIMVLTGDFLPVGFAILMFVCIPMLLAVTISLKGEIDGWD